MDLNPVVLLQRNVNVPIKNEVKVEDTSEEESAEDNDPDWGEENSNYKANIEKVYKDSSSSEDENEDHVVVEKEDKVVDRDQKQKEYEEAEKIIVKHFKMVCYVCSYEFKDYRDFRKHFIKNHKGKKVFLECLQCNSGLPRWNTMMIHIKNHAEPKIKQFFSCEICSKTFKSKISLSTHILSHRGERNFVCKFSGCTKTYLTKYQLKFHEREVHTPENKRKFVCGICKSRFASSSTLKIHQNQRHNDFKKSFICDICGTKLATRGSLKYHLSTHLTDDSPYRVQCKICLHW